VPRILPLKKTFYGELCSIGQSPLNVSAYEDSEHTTAG
jgi:hypothetical protein